MAPKRKRSPRARSRSPEKKIAKSPRKTKTSRYAQSPAPLYGTKKEMKQKIDLALEPIHGMTRDVRNLMEQYGNFDECDGPTELGKLCLKGKDYFKRVHKMNCTSYCGNASNCGAWMSYLLSQIPPEVTVVDTKDSEQQMDAKIDSITFAFDVERTHQTYFSLKKYVNIEHNKEIIEESKIELKYPYLWHVHGLIKATQIKDSFLNISDAQAVEYFCKLLQSAEPWGDNFSLSMFVSCKGKSPIGQLKPSKVKFVKLPSVLSDTFVEAHLYPRLGQVEGHFSFRL